MHSRRSAFKSLALASCSSLGGAPPMRDESSEEVISYMDGYQGGVAGHMSPGSWRDILSALGHRRGKPVVPTIYAAMQQFFHRRGTRVWCEALRQRQAQFGFRAAVRMIPQRDRAAVGFGDLLYQRQPHPGTVWLGGIERHKQVGRVRDSQA